MGTASLAGRQSLCKRIVTRERSALLMVKMMKNDETFRELLWAYVDGELNEDQMAEVAKLIKVDTALADDVDQMRKMGQMLASMPREHASASLAAKIILASREQNSTKVRTIRFGWVKRFAAAAIVLLVAGVSIWIVANNMSDNQPVDNPPVATVKPVPLVVDLANFEGDPKDLYKKLGSLLGNNSLQPGYAAINNDGRFIVKIDVPVDDADTYTKLIQTQLGRGATVRKQTEKEARDLARGGVVTFVPTSLNDGSDKSKAYAEWLEKTTEDLEANNDNVEELRAPSSNNNSDPKQVKKVKPIFLTLPLLPRPKND